MPERLPEKSIKPVLLAYMKMAKCLKKTIIDEKNDESEIMLQCQECYLVGILYIIIIYRLYNVLVYCIYYNMSMNCETMANFEYYVIFSTFEKIELKFFF